MLHECQVTPAKCYNQCRPCQNSLWKPTTTPQKDKTPWGENVTLHWRQDYCWTLSASVCLVLPIVHGLVILPAFCIGCESIRCCHWWPCWTTFIPFPQQWSYCSGLPSTPDWMHTHCLNSVCLSPHCTGVPVSVKKSCWILAPSALPLSFCLIIMSNSNKILIIIILLW